MFNPKGKSSEKFWKYFEQLKNCYENLPLKQDHKLYKMLIIFRVINIFQQDRNLTFFVIYFHKINILSSAWDH